MKTKNILGIIAVCLALSACYYYNPEDRGAERAEKLAIKRANEGCLSIDDHEAYRNCLLATVKQNSPKTYVTAEDSNGNPLAIIKSNVPCDGTCAASQTILKTEVKTTVIEEPAKVIKSEIIETPAVEADISVEVEAPKEKTWWENYQENKPEDKPAEVKCPCEDPNDPCPQCVEK
ncbi:MAG: hypothetical protein IKV03_00600 [Alphaproteobacteria bacterium]|nr:hypothetical protein [Alphaproteobacteria bacterium]